MRIDNSLATSRIIMYSYGMHPDSAKLQELIVKVESGEIEAARNGLREFIQKRPSTLLAWKLLADVAQNAKERSGAIRRAQLLAPGDPWVIEAKKHRRPPERRRREPKRPTDSADREAANTEPTETVTENEGIGENVSEKLVIPIDETPPHAGDRAAGENVAAPSGTMQGRHPHWAIWVAAAMGLAGLALLVIAWQLGSF